MARKIKDDIRYYDENRKQLVKKYIGRYIVIKDQVVIADFKTKKQASRFASREYEKGTFLIKKVLPVIQSNRMIYYSRITL